MNITQLELQVVKAFIDSSMDSCGDFSHDQNMSWSNDKDISDATGLTRHQVAALFGSLLDKRLITDSGDSARGAKCNDYFACPTRCANVPEIVEYINSLS
jgi:hypothetical protein